MPRSKKQKSNYMDMHSVVAGQKQVVAQLDANIAHLEAQVRAGHEELAESYRRGVERTEQVNAMQAELDAAVVLRNSLRAAVEAQ